ncbi:MAG: DUF1850 domain-containing protein [Tissierellaceae bacterium]
MKKVLNKIYLKGKGIGGSFNTFPTYFAIILILLVLIFFLWLYPQKLLLATDYKSGKYLRSWPIGEGEEFAIVYTHSVELTEVVEDYLIVDHKIILKDTYFKSYGAGLPATTPYKFEITEKGFRIYDIDEEMENLIYRTGAERANHRLLLRDKEYKFLDFSGPRTGVKLDVKGTNLLFYLVREAFR